MAEKKTPPSVSKALGQAWAAELQWFTAVLDARLNQYFQIEGVPIVAIHSLEPPDLSASDTPFADIVRAYSLGFEERLALALAVTPVIRPQLLDVFFTKNKTFDRPFAEFGGVNRTGHQGFLPTLETLLFLLSGADLAIRLQMTTLFSSENPLFQERLLVLGNVEQGAPPQSAALQISMEAYSTLVLGQTYHPDFSNDFPAHPLKTALTWADLVVHPITQKHLLEITVWSQHGHKLLNDWGMRSRLRPGLRCLFYGPPGTGKTLAATLLGRETNCPVFRIDLSMVVSKYIGETEKNLSRIFDQAERRHWILFFDEADALFGKRTDTNNAHDRYANQEVSYLLQRIETFDGIVILASNRRHNIDEAFLRRFESVIHFPMPRPEERLRLWQQSIPPNAPLAADIDLRHFANTYELSGGAIMNVIRFAALQALDTEGALSAANLREGVERELGKEGRG